MVRIKDTSIEWAENTVNFYMGCTKVSPGCANCYMYRLMPRFGRDPNVVTKMNWKNIERNLKKWNPSRIFVNSMSDSFHKDIPEEEIEEMFSLMGKYSQHQYLILTKRIERAWEFYTNGRGWYEEPNVWIGTSVENEKTLHRIETLKKIPAYIKFVSIEPLLEKINEINLEGINWVIVGGESDPKPREMKEDWIEPIFNECKKHKIPFFFKQWGGSKKCDCHKTWGCRTYKGKTWDELPDVKQIIK